MSTLKLGLIGAGGIAQAHLTALKDYPQAEFIAVCDVVHEHAERTAAKWNIPCIFDDYQELVQVPELDAVFVCTPTAQHAGPTVAALNAGKHVLCEKPMEATLDAATAMVRAAIATRSC